MTNNPRIDGVSRELIGVPRSLLENAIDYMEGSASPQVNLWRAKLLTCIATMPYNAIAAPVVERKEPTAWDVLTSRGGWYQTVRGKCTADALEAGGFKIVPLYTAQPQLAELQTTVARYLDRITELQAQLENLGEDVGQLRSELEDAAQERDELQATIERQTALLAEARNALSEIRKACDEGRTYGLIDMLAEDATAALNKE